jgi:hypothetical protein
VSRACLCFISLSLAACHSPYAVESNLREPGEPASVNRRLTGEQQEGIVDAMVRSQSLAQREAARPLAPAGDAGRWVDVPVVARKAASDCEMGVLSEERIEGGLRYRLRSIQDDPGTLTVMGDPQHGVASVKASVGDFGQRQEAARRLERAFRERLREWARVPRSPEDLPVADQTAVR